MIIYNAVITYAIILRVKHIETCAAILISSKESHLKLIQCVNHKSYRF